MQSIKAALSREAILAQKGLKQETVDVLEWGGTVVVRELTAKERDDFERACVKQKGKRSYEADLVNLRAKLIVRSVRTDTGERMFQDSDVEALGELSAAAVSRVAAVAMRLSGISDEDVEDLVGNSNGEPSGSSPTGSPTA